jgi:3-dehydroquinate dehydratase-1
MNGHHSDPDPGHLLRNPAPRVIAVVDTLVPLAVLLDLRRDGVDCLEIRVDLISAGPDALVHYLSDINARVGMPLIGTVREGAAPTPDRLRLFDAIMPFVNGIDIELGCAILPDVVNRAHALGKTVIVSEHDFEKTPVNAALQSIVERSVAGGADIVKIAAMAQSEDDAMRLLTFMQACAVPMAAFAMGEKGTFSRVEACNYGSVFTYGYITTPVAPGQLSALELVRKLKKEVTK